MALIENEPKERYVSYDVRSFSAYIYALGVLSLDFFQDVAIAKLGKLHFEI